MGIKQDARNWTVKEQIVEDLASGLTIQFEVVPDSTARYQLRIFGECLPCGNREIVFDVGGKEAGAGSATTGLSKPTWSFQLDD